jgi:hypothetical protein
MEKKIEILRSGLMGWHPRLLGSSPKTMILKLSAEDHGAYLMDQLMLYGSKI